MERVVVVAWGGSMEPSRLNKLHVVHVVNEGVLPGMQDGRAWHSLVCSCCIKASCLVLCNIYSGRG